VWAEFSVREVVAMGRYALPADPAAIEDALRDAQLLDRADEPFALLSAGQQQRAAIARVLAQVRGKSGAPPGATRCVLADEPIAAMDPAHSLWAMTILRALASTGLTIVVVLHDFTLAARFADTALVLDDAGQVAASGPVAESLDPAVLSRVFHTQFHRLSADGHSALLPLGATDTI
jgi:iron complex transport system ATP-binding protein